MPCPRTPRDPQPPHRWRQHATSQTEAANLTYKPRETAEIAGSGSSRGRHTGTPRTRRSPHCALLLQSPHGDAERTERTEESLEDVLRPRAGRVGGGAPLGRTQASRRRFGAGPARGGVEEELDVEVSDSSSVLMSSGNLAVDAAAADCGKQILHRASISSARGGSSP